jgi:hypothetical protein
MIEYAEYDLRSPSLRSLRCEVPDIYNCLNIKVRRQYVPDATTAH